MFDWLASLVNRRGWLVLVGWLAFAAALYATAPAWSTVSRDDDVRFFPANYPSVLGQELLERGFPADTASSSVVLVAERPDRHLTDKDREFILDISRRLRSLVETDKSLGIKRVDDLSLAGLGPKLIGTRPDGPGQAALTMVSLQGTYVSRQARQAVDRLSEELDQFRAKAPDGLVLEMTGAAAVGRDTNRASTTSVGATTYATIILVIAILLCVYRSPLLALIPLATIALSVWTSLMAIALLTRLPGLHFQVINITNVFVVVVLFGAGTDYCLFLIARYREELRRGRRGPEALTEAIRQVSGALVASAGTVIVGLGMLWFSTFAKIQYTGPAIALSLAIALVASLTLAPVLLHWLRAAVFWPFAQPHHTKGADPEQESLEETPMSGLWAWVANVVVRYPGLILVASILALIPLAVVGTKTKASYDLLADLTPDQPSVRGARIIERYFAAGELGPSSVLVDHPTLDFRSDAGVDAIERACRELEKLPDVHEVRAVSRPLGKTLKTVADRLNPPKTTPSNFFSRLGRQASEQVTERLIRTQADPHYVSTAAAGADRDHITKISVIFKTAPFATESLAALDRVRQRMQEATGSGRPLAGARQIGLSGTTTLVNDLRHVTSQDETRMYILVTVGVYVILVVLLRRPGICLYLIATVVVGYLASLGLTELVFRSLHQGPQPWSGLDWKVGFFLFVILVAVGEDYNIFLMSRVLEEERRHGPIEGTRRAVAHTGGIISSCGLIMAGTFASMLIGNLSALRELGFALGIGVLLDTFIVRPILVPAFVVLLHGARPSTRRRSRLTKSSIPLAVPPQAQGPRRPVGLWAGQRFKDGWR
jgi:RND superfamily putative drug exporter